MSTFGHHLILGLTGSIGMGKSTVARMFEDEGVPVFDADAAVHVLQGPGGALLDAIEAEFPESTGPGGVDRVRLGEQVFKDPEALARLEGIVHPAVAELRSEFLLEHAGAPILLFDIPLLFEKGGEKRVDQIVVVSAPAEIQRQRVLGRPGMTAEKFAHILSLQVPDADKRARADHVIDTSGSLDETRQAVRELVAQLKRSRAAD
ncbi:dephospho-CoA kinase [Allopontixanthobacter sp.]|uniref:dephospho-CoA kinase n=1 Tax=Allopontixanthobacter sp. TaxID=2906452 RepID=UPI002ABA3453|nr:dephospho-CoA kinase [Allopontixanthobacter sp.]MDZ4308486.1 dephospho-CoA kinase [Allopontixanthobacter sp.]